MREAFIAELMTLAAADKRVTLITGDLGFGVLDQFAKCFPNQYINAGVAEQNMTALACGMALEGYKVYTYSIGNFATLRCLEQIRNDVCYHEADVTVVSVGGGFSYGQLGMSHFATEDLAILRALPNMMVVAPSDPWEAAELTRQMAASTGPKYLRLDKGNGNLPAVRDQVKLGQARIARHGSDVTILALGSILREAISAAEQLSMKGIECRVLAIHCLKPLDTEPIVLAARETQVMLTLEEHTVVGGLGGAVAEACLDSGITPLVFRRIGLGDIFATTVGDQNYLRSTYGMDAAAVVAAVLEALRVSQ